MAKLALQVKIEEKEIQKQNDTFFMKYSGKHRLDKFEKALVTSNLTRNSSFNFKREKK